MTLRSHEFFLVGDALPTGRPGNPKPPRAPIAWTIAGIATAVSVIAVICSLSSARATPRRSASARCQRGARGHDREPGRSPRRLRAREGPPRAGSAAARDRAEGARESRRRRARGLLKAEAARGDAKIETLEDGRVRVELAHRLLFPTEGATIGPEGQESLGRLGAVLAGLGDRTFEIVGHVDTRSRRATTRWVTGALGRAREPRARRARGAGESVAEEAHGVGQGRHERKGGRAKNKRVEGLRLPLEAAAIRMTPRAAQRPRAARVLLDDALRAACATAVVPERKPRARRETGSALCAAARAGQVLHPSHARCPRGRCAGVIRARSAGADDDGSPSLGRCRYWLRPDLRRALTSSDPRSPLRDVTRRISRWSPVVLVRDPLRRREERKALSPLRVVLVAASVFITSSVEVGPEGARFASAEAAAPKKSKKKADDKKADDKKDEEGRRQEGRRQEGRRAEARGEAAHDRPRADPARRVLREEVREHREGGQEARRADCRDQRACSRR